MAKKPKKAKLVRTRHAPKPQRFPDQPRVKKIDLPIGHVAHVEVPVGYVPVVAVDPVKRVVQVVQVPRKKSWWDKLWE